jgi:hypothetical protein
MKRSLLIEACFIVIRETETEISRSKAEIGAFLPCGFDIALGFI